MTKTQAYLQYIKNVYCTCMTKRPEAQYHKKDCPLNSPDNPFQVTGELFQLADGCIDCGPFTRAYGRRFGDVIRNHCGTCGTLWETDVYSPYRERIELGPYTQAMGKYPIIATEPSPKAEISALQSRVDNLDSHIEGPIEPLKKPVRERSRFWRWLEVIAEGIGGLARGLT